jgi:hypothetical protein
MQIWVEIDEAGAAALDQIKASSGLRDYREVLNEGIAILEWAIKQQAAGKIVATLDEKTRSYKKLRMRALRRGASRCRVVSTP